MAEPSVCIDLDGVLARWEPWRGVTKFGKPIRGAAEFTRRISGFVRVVIYSCRGNVELGQGRPAEELRDLMKRWLDKHGFAYHEIWIGQGKPIATAYIDDRAVVCRPEREAKPQDAFEKALVDLQELLRPR